MCNNRLSKKEGIGRQAKLFIWSLTLWYARVWNISDGYSRRMHSFCDLDKMQHTRFIKHNLFILYTYLLLLYFNSRQTVALFSLWFTLNPSPMVRKILLFLLSRNYTIKNLKKYIIDTCTLKTATYNDGLFAYKITD